ncbi:hypothetical protein KFE25_003602 [Diacronema lutheri]|uniref:CRAL-TRIO domain-containing protein n=2 Tax=Diacronema lutheri TaxID=2081491 RepID=A0A8J6CB21_DIALT|nr:hypothetical protein KFE25_003602 [Diacronema lutheri]
MAAMPSAAGAWTWAGALLTLTLGAIVFIAARLERHARRAALRRAELRAAPMVPRVVAPPRAAASPMAPPGGHVGRRADGRRRSPARVATAGTLDGAQTDADAFWPAWAERSFPEMPAGITQPLASPDELEAIRAIRQAARAQLAGVRSPEVSSDVRILRFLRGYSTVGEARSRYLEMLAWRQALKMDAICDAVRGLPLEMRALPHGELLGQVYPTTLLVGRTREGHLVSRDEIGRADVAALFARLGEKRTEEWFLHFFELRALLLDEASEREGALVQSVQVKDLAGLSLSVLRSADGRRGLALVRRVLATATRYYPESALTLWILNAPSWFVLPWRMVSTVLTARTVAKVRIHSADFLPALRASGHLELELLEKMGYVDREPPSAR